MELLCEQEWQLFVANLLMRKSLVSPIDCHMISFFVGFPPIIKTLIIRKLLVLWFSE
jgi:hypothetical protein